MIKRVLFFLGIILLTGGIFGYLYLYQDHRDVKAEAAAYVLSADEFTREFTANAEQATQKYLNKVVEINGTLTDTEEKGLTLNETIYALLDTTAVGRTYASEKEVTIKGRCIGYDELLEIVKLDQVSVIDK